VSRFDKYDPYSGGFRAKLEAAITAPEVGVVQAISINASGKVVVGGATLNLIRGIICPVQTMAAGDVIDVMTGGEIVDCLTTAGPAFSAGAVVYAHTAGTLDGVATAGLAVGQMIEATRMVVRIGLGAMSAAVANTAPTLALNDLADVNTAGVADGQQLTYVAAAAAGDKWQPGASGV